MKELKKEIIEMIEKVDDMWILQRIKNFIVYIQK